MNIRCLIGVAIATWVSGTALTAQTLSPEDLKALIDERLNQVNPYQELLADPDPDRSLAAMQIMLETGDRELMRMALEYGALSPNGTVQRLAVEAYMASGPILSLKMDGSQVEDKDYKTTVTGRYDGVVDPDGFGYVRIPVGEFDSNLSCFLQPGRESCLVTVNKDGVFLTLFVSASHSLNARLTVNDAGQLQGAVSMGYVDDSIPSTIELID